MKTVLAVAALLGSALASAHEHGAHHAQLHKKDYATSELPTSTEAACTPSWTTWYGEATLVQPAPSSTSTTSSSSSSSSSVYVAPSSSATPSASTGASYSESTGSSNSGSSSSSGSSASISGGNRWAMTYSPYQGSSSSTSSCKSSSQVLQDISQIAAKGFSTVRIYATDCSQLQNVGAAAKQYGLKLIPGIFIDSSGLGSDTYSQLNDIVSYFSGDYSMVEMMVFGNEALFNNYATGSELASFLSTAKGTLQQAGYSGPVTTTDTVSAIQANAGALCGNLDVVAANIHPFFNGNVQPSGAGAFVDQQMQMLGSACSGGKAVYNVETGWPSAGPSYMNAVPSTENQAAAISSLESSSSASKSAFFSFENDGWKNDGSDSVEPYWGCAQVFSG